MALVVLQVRPSLELGSTALLIPPPPYHFLTGFLVDSFTYALIFPQACDLIQLHDSGYLASCLGVLLGIFFLFGLPTPLCLPSKVS